MNKLSTLYKTLCPLLIAAGCATNEDPQSVDLDGDFEGIEEAAQGLTDLRARCSWASGSGTATLALVGGDVAMVNKLPNGLLGVNGYACDATATVVLLKKLVVTGTALGSETVILDYLSGVFSPGTMTGGVGVDVDLGTGAGTDALKFRGTKLADTFSFGTVAGVNGIAINGDAFKDISVANVENFVVTLTDGDDSFTGAGSPAAGAGLFAAAVTVYGGGGNDTLRGGAVADTLNGGDGNDTFTTGTVADGADVMVGGAGTDTADYSARTTAVTVTIDTVADDGGTGEMDKVNTDIEVLKGGTVADNLTGSAGPDTISGGAGNDTIAGGDGIDVLNGDAGDDTFTESAAPNGADIFNGGAGTDTVSYALRSGSVTVILDALANDGETAETDKVMLDVENVTGGGGADTLTGSPLDNVLVGGAAIDTISGGAGNDTLRGGLGADILRGDAGDDTFDEETATNGADNIGGGLGIDKVDYSARTEDLVVAMDGLIASGEASEGDIIATDVENLFGGAGADSLTGNAFDNQIEGGAGIDLIFGGAGEDLIDGGADEDVVDCGAGDSDVLLDATATDAGPGITCEL